MAKINNCENFPLSLSSISFINKIQSIFKQKIIELGYELTTLNSNEIQNRQQILFNIFEVWYFKNKASSFVLNKLWQILNKDQKYFGLSYLIYETNAGRFERILLREVYSNLPHPTFVGRALGPEKFDYKFVEATQDGDLMFGLNQFNHIRVHSAFARRRRRHFVFFWFCQIIFLLIFCSTKASLSQDF